MTLHPNAELLQHSYDAFGPETCSHCWTWFATTSSGLTPPSARSLAHSGQARMTGQCA